VANFSKQIDFSLHFQTIKIQFHGVNDGFFHNRFIV
jgi:hypothetical protein